MSKPEIKKLRVYMFEIAGVRYRMGAYRNANVKAGDPLKFVPEPDNSHDPKAIALHKDKWHIGYVPRVWNDGIGQLLKDVGPEGVICVVSEAKPHTAYVEVYLDTAALSTPTNLDQARQVQTTPAPGSSHA